MSSEASGALDRTARDAPRQPVVVVGVGNLLLSDEGLGVHAVQALAARQSDALSYARLIDAGTALVDVVADCLDADTIILLDALRAGHPPGTVYRLPLDPAELSRAAPRGGWSLHDWDVLDALAAASIGGQLPHRMVLMGIEPSSLEPGTLLSAAVTRSMDALLDAVEREIMEAGTTPPADQ